MFAAAIRTAVALIAFWLAGAPLAATATANDTLDRNVVESAPQETQILLMIRMAPAHFRPDVGYGDGYAGRSGHAARRRAAEDIARKHELQLLTHWPMPAIGVECYVMQVRPGVTVSAAVEAVSQDPRAAWAQPVQTFRGLGYNDPLYDFQPTASEWQLHRLHAIATGRGVLIAQVDSGVDVAHPDLRGQLRLVHNAVAHSRYAPETHGTAVAGIIAARANNGIGTVGVAPDARLLALRGCWERPRGGAVCDTLSLAKAVQFALDHGAHIVNVSLSGPADRLLHELLNAVIERGMIVVAAASPDASDGGFPASHPGVISVADAGAVVPARATLTAPGLDVLATLPGARWGMVSGASFAAAEVSGMVALLLELMPGTRAPQIDAMLRRVPQRTMGGAALVPSPVDACHSVSLAAGRCVCGCTAAAPSSN